jgi:Zn-dependent peptidase ImmA (M78 family)
MIPVRPGCVSVDNANAFAVELLMERERRENFEKDSVLDTETIERATEYFKVSLSAAVIRYSQVSGE